MDDLLDAFLTETAERLAAVDSQLVRLEAHPRERAVLDALFRLVHTTKGSCGFLHLPRLEALADGAETLLGRIRAGLLPVTPELVSLLLSTMDRMRDLLSHLELFGVEPDGDDGALLGRVATASLPARPTAPPVPLPASEATPPSTPDPLPAVEPGPATPSPAPRVTRPTVRVGVDVLDDLLSRVGELVLTRNQLLDVVRDLDDAALKGPLQRLSVLTGELQERVMDARVQPLATAWAALPRVARDAAAAEDKQVALILEGQDIELDRQVLERIKDPLIQLVRNCVHHGIETPAERVRAGKPETGTLRLSGRQEGGQVIVRVTDDGRGFDTDAIRAAAVAMGLIGPADRPGDAQAHRLIFAPGLSTSTGPGRGVGLDIVRAHIEELDGRIELGSIAGQGASFTLRIPLSLAVTSALIVQAGGRRFAVPRSAVLAVDEGADAPTLAGLLGLPAAAEARAVVTLQGGDRRAAVAVEAAFHTQEVVVRPIADRDGCSGATVLEDGGPALVLDVEVLLDRAIARLAPDRTGGHVLLIDDNPVFREMMSTLLDASGWNIRAVPSPDDAWALHENGETADAIVAGLELWSRDDHALSTRLAASRWASAPRIALTALPPAGVLDRAPPGALAAAVRRSDRQGLMDALARLLASPQPSAAYCLSSPSHDAQPRWGGLG